jgi:uncharacterized membrane protein YkvA (DUF1232 family)
LKILSSLKAWARALKTDVVALSLAARDPRVPWYAKALAAAVVAYAASPIDLIPDFIPVLGYVDDLFIVPLGILMAVKLVPAPLMREFREEAKQRMARPASRAGMAAVIVIWLVLAAILVGLLWPWMAGSASGG